MVHKGITFRFSTFYMGWAPHVSAYIQNYRLVSIISPLIRRNLDLGRTHTAQVLVGLREETTSSAACFG